jgi:hypothetical protein
LPVIGVGLDYSQEPGIALAELFSRMASSTAIADVAERLRSEELKMRDYEQILRKTEEFAAHYKEFEAFRKSLGPLESYVSIPVYSRVSVFAFLLPDFFEVSKEKVARLRARLEELDRVELAVQ